MPIFQYTARDGQGQMVRETLAFNNEISLRDYLRRNNLFVLEVAEQRSTRAWLPFRRGVGLADLVITTRQLRTMITAGMPLVTGLEALAQQSTNPALTQVLTQVSRAVGHGQSLAAVLEEYPRIFPQMLVALVRAGEEGGRLPETLREAGRQLELQAEIRQKLISAMVYPLFTLCATVGTVLVMLLWIVPIFAKIYEDLHARLPAMTLSLIWVSNLLLSYGWMVALLVAAAGLAFRQYNRTPQGRLTIDRLKLRIPLFGGLFLKSGSASLTGSLAGLTESGVPLIQALNTSANTCGNEVLASAARIAAENVALGRRLSDELERSGHFPLMVTRMISIAEEVGTLPLVLREVATAYNEEVDYTVRRVMGLVEPVMILFIGAIVGYVLLALYYPIFNLGNAFINGS